MHHTENNMKITDDYETILNHRPQRTQMQIRDHKEKTTQSHLTENHLTVIPLTPSTNA